MRTKLLGLALTVVSLFLIVQGRRNAATIPSDLRDAPASEQLGLGGSDAPTVPAPEPELLHEKAAGAAQGEEAPFLALHLHSAPFMGASPAETRQRAMEFLAGLGLRVTRYQDNNDSGAVDAEFVPPSGLLNRVTAYLERKAAIKRITARPEVESMRAYGGNTLAYIIVFKEPLYDAEADRIVALGGGLTITERYQNKAMLGSLWVDAEIADVAVAGRKAEKLLRDHPDRIFLAQVSIKVTAFSAVLK
ncbi:MAG: hypothetical protein AAB359_06900 [Elusimicrobiota bacterium]